LRRNSRKLAPKGTEWHWVWETFGQLPLRNKRLGIGKWESAGSPARDRLWQFELLHGAAKPNRSAGPYQAASRSCFRAAPNGPRFSS